MSGGASNPGPEMASIAQREEARGPTAGWAVRLTVPRMGEGPPMVRMYMVAIADKAEAEAAVRKRIGRTNRQAIEGVVALTPQTVALLDLKPGEVRGAGG